MTEELKGLVLRVTGSWYNVLLPDKSIFPCRIRGKMRLQNRKVTNPIAVGDFVILEIEENGEAGVIKEVVSRDNYIVRQSPKKSAFAHVIAANVDQVFLILTLREPDLKFGFLDRFLLSTTMFEIPTYLIFNKADLYDESDFEFLEQIKSVYEPLGYKVKVISAEDNFGIDELEFLLKEKKTLFAGHSGVGKSSTINRLNPNFDIKTQVISDYTGKGMHTTTFSEMFQTEENTFIIDTPGIKEFGVLHLEPEEVGKYFKEIFAYSSECKFNDCKHISEPHCKVIEAVELGEIAFSRYENYTHVVNDIESQNYWERK